MRISFVTSNLAPFRIDWLDELAKYEDVTIFYNDSVVRDVNQEYMKRRPQKAKYINISKYIIGSLRVFDFHKIISNKSDIIILDGYGFYSQLLLIFLLKTLSIPFVLSVDGGILNDTEKKIKYYFKRMIISSASYYLSTSKTTDVFLMKYGAIQNRIFRHKFTSLHLKDVSESILASNAKGVIRNRLNIKDIFTIVAVGKFIKSKGFDVLLESLTEVKSNVSVIIIGGKQTEEYSNIIKSKNIKNVTFVNFCSKELLNDYYNAADVFVLPTRSDVWGLVINEAMSKGLPVITTDKCVAGVTLIEENVNGYIIPTNNSSMLADRIDKLASDEKLRFQMASNNLNKISEYTIEQIVKNDIISLNSILELEREKNV